MAADPSQILADEKAWRSRAAIASIAGGLLTLIGGILASLRYRDLPDVPVVAALREHLSTGTAQQPGLKARQALWYDEHALELVGIALLLSLGAAAIGLTLVYLYKATKARRAELPRAVLIAAVAGSAAVSVAGIIQAIGVTVEASAFAGAKDQSSDAARDVLQAPLVVAALIMRQLGVFALGFAFILIALNAMRVGLLTRFMGVLGMIVGALFIVPLGSSLPIVQSFWLLALGVLFLGRWPNGNPPAWDAGEARPWPSQQELREARMGKTSAGDAESREKEDPRDLDLPQAPAPERPAHSSSNKRKRKRRS